MFKVLVGTLLLAATTALYAQATPPADAGKGARKGHRFDCSQAKDQKACEERRDKMRDAMKKAHSACEAKKDGERRDCMRKEMCAQSKDPARCEARVKQGAEQRKQRRESQTEKK